jgi:large subunit ribosomal protein L31e
MSDNKDIVEEQVYTVPLDHAWITPIWKRTPREIRILKEFIAKSMGADTIVIGSEVNERLWSRGMEGKSRKIRVRAVKDKDNIVKVYLAEGE